MMEITTTNIQQTSLVKPVSAQKHKNLEMPQRDNLSKKTAQVTEDDVLLSKEALKLAHTPATQSGVSGVEIENSEQAQKVVEQVIADVRSLSRGADSAYGNLSQVNFKLLLE